MSATYSPIQRRKLSDDVRERVLQLIRSGDFVPGDTLPSEREMMQTFEVGRPAIREAMQSLQRMGLVEIKHGGRPRVAEPSVGHMTDQLGETMRHLLMHSPASFEHLKEARATFETEMARIAARKCSAQDLERIRRIVDLQEAASDDSPRFLELDGQFHREIANISGNPIFASLSEALFNWLAEFHVSLVRHPGLETLTVAEHRGILAAIANRDPAAAGKAMAEHLYRANALYRQQGPPFR